jgi:septal ring factor EnvC (AmiA/AmiB activator)
MPSQENEGFRASGSKVADNCTELENDTRRQRALLNKSISTASTPIVDLPETLSKLKREGRHLDAVTIGNLVKNLARDVDALIKERNDIDKVFDEIITQRPRKLRQLSDYHNRLMVCGSQYLALNQRAFNTVMRDFDDYVDLVEPPLSRQPASAGVI